MSRQMTELQKQMPKGVELVSFTVDPEHDSPQVLKEYGQAYQADFSRWHFLTGTKPQMMDAALAMKISVHPADKDFALTHSDKFLLVNQSGHVVGVYDGTNSQDVSRLAADAAKLVATGDGGKSS
jgi:protein SCO1/2